MREIKRNGFTLIELSLSITFISVLSIIVVVMISNAVSAYHKGLTLNQINTVGAELVDNIRTTIQGSPAQSAVNDCSNVYVDPNVVKECEEDNAKSFIYIEKYANNIKIGDRQIGDNDSGVPIGGVFCTGAYSYIWNSGYLYQGGATHDPISLKYSIDGPSNTISSRLLKVQDNERYVCKKAAGVVDSMQDANGNYNVGSGEAYKDQIDNTTIVIDISSKMINAEPEDLLAGSVSLAVYDFTTALPADNSAANSLFYPISFVLGTIQGGIDVTANGNYCAAPEDYDRSGAEDFDYCAINKFNFAAIANGG